MAQYVSGPNPFGPSPEECAVAVPPDPIDTPLGSGL